jgi:hypothetical protein
VDKIDRYGEIIAVGRSSLQYRELLYFLTWRDIKVRYKQTMIGAAWAIIPPFFTMVASSSGTCAATLPSTAEPAARAGAAP